MHEVSNKVCGSIGLAPGAPNDWSSNDNMIESGTRDIMKHIRNRESKRQERGMSN